MINVMSGAHNYAQDTVLDTIFHAHGKMFKKCSKTCSDSPRLKENANGFLFGKKILGKIVPLYCHVTEFVDLDSLTNQEQGCAPFTLTAAAATE